MQSEAQKKAVKRYNDKNYKIFSVNAKIDQYIKIDKYCTDNGISKSKLLLTAALYVIDNNIKID